MGRKTEGERKREKAREEGEREREREGEGVEGVIQRDWDEEEEEEIVTAAVFSTHASALHCRGCFFVGIACQGALVLSSALARWFVCDTACLTTTRRARGGTETVATHVDGANQFSQSMARVPGIPCK